MATIKSLSGHTRITKICHYVTRPDKTRADLCSGIYCMPENAGKQMMATKRLWHKTSGRTYKHFVQSFAPGEKITPEQAHSMACKLANDFPAWQGYEVLIATHIDRDHIHNHFVVNSVSFENGRKLRWEKKDLALLKERSDELCQLHGLSIAVKGKTFEGAEREEIASPTSQSYRLLRAAEKREIQSYIQDIALAVMDARETATSRNEFIKQMAERGYRTDWDEKHKYITFTDIARENAGEKKCKVRNKKLSDYYNINFTKEELEDGFSKNARRAESRTNGTGTGEAQKSAVSAFISKLRTNEGAGTEKQKDNIHERGADSSEEKNGRPYSRKQKAPGSGRRDQKRSQEDDYSR